MKIRSLHPVFPQEEEQIERVFFSVFENHRMGGIGRISMVEWEPMIMIEVEKKKTMMMSLFLLHMSFYWAD